MIDALTEKAEQIAYEAFAIQSVEARADFLGRACQGDSALRGLVEALLGSQPAAEDFFDKQAPMPVSISKVTNLLPEMPASALLPPTEECGSFIGPYKLLQKIGEGGCGVVYMAEQERPIRRRVALKIIKLGMDTKSVIARFEAERQALALMDHPNIARVMDAGSTVLGRPYFVMELVRGIKITDYSDQHQLDTPQRLKLFLQVCRAIQHAHQKGVIHRDIKPSNILVTIIDGQAIPKVIDFGIAKAIAGRLTDNTVFTAYDQFIGTPAYMSPEQAVMSGVDVDTRSDIYSLGVLLYELLTGRPPFETKELLERGMDDFRRTLQDREPQRPSVLLTTMEGPAIVLMAQRRHTDPVKLIQLLHGDLDWIVIKSLEKDRALRYETVNGLAMDVQRFLNEEPVIARPPSRLYRLQKLARRNKVAFASGVAVVVALTGGLGMSSWFLLNARQARDRAIQAEKQQLGLRVEAEDREKIAQAAYLIARGKIEEADNSVSKVANWHPSLEAESVLRTLGEWHALKGHWTRAANRFGLLLQADQSDDARAISTDLLMAGPIQIELGDIDGYEHFRLAAIRHFLGTSDPIDAERTLKISLLLPADATTIKSLQQFSDLAAASLKEASAKPENRDVIMDAWRCISLALMAYRQGDMPAARSWCQKCLSYDQNNPSRIATAHVIQAMTCFKLGETDECNSELAEGQKLIGDDFAHGLQAGNGAGGYWYDWLFARILLREAQATLKEAP